MSRVLVINAYVVDGAQVVRSDTGSPSLSVEASRAVRLILATEVGDGGWTIETWRHDGAHLHSTVALVDDYPSLAVEIDDAVRQVLSEA